MAQHAFDFDGIDPEMLVKNLIKEIEDANLMKVKVVKEEEPIQLPVNHNRTDFQRLVAAKVCMENTKGYYRMAHGQKFPETTSLPGGLNTFEESFTFMYKDGGSLYRAKDGKVCVQNLDKTWDEIGTYSMRPVSTRANVLIPNITKDENGKDVLGEIEVEMNALSYGQGKFVASNQFAGLISTLVAGKQEEFVIYNVSPGTLTKNRMDYEKKFKAYIKTSPKDAAKMKVPELLPESYFFNQKELDVLVGGDTLFRAYDVKTHFQLAPTDPDASQVSFFDDNSTYDVNEQCNCEDCEGEQCHPDDEDYDDSKPIGFDDVPEQD